MSKPDSIKTIGLPKGRLFKPALKILAQEGLIFPSRAKKYFYQLKFNSHIFNIRIVKNCDLARMVKLGIYDLGFTGLDWIKEFDLTENLIQEFPISTVRMVSAISKKSNWQTLKSRKIICATEYVNIAKKYLKNRNCNFSILKIHGAAEGYIPNDANMIIDIIDKGDSLLNHHLKKMNTLFISRLCLIGKSKYGLNNKSISNFLWQ